MKRAFVLLLALALAIEGCGDATAPQAPVVSIAVTSSDDTLRALGATRQLTAVARDSTGAVLTGASFSWNVTAPAIAGVNASGLVTALDNGEVTVVATAAGVAGTLRLNVAQMAATLTLDPVTLTGLGTTIATHAVAKDSNQRIIVSPALSWTSSDTNVAGVDASGLVTARGLGATTIIAQVDGAPAIAAATVLPHFYVDATLGSDGNAGTSAAPFRTITHALGIATESQTIKVRPGRYDDALGETFPLAGPAGVYLVGDEASKGGGATPTLIVAPPTGDYAWEAAAGALIAGFTVTDSGASQALWVKHDRTTVRNNRLLHSTKTAILIIGQSRGNVIAANVIDGNGGGIDIATFTDDSAVTARIEYNIITNNTFGVTTNTSGGDLGGGALGSHGGNVLSCNSYIDLFLFSPVGAVFAMNNQWDHTPLTESNSPSGAGLDLYRPNASTLVSIGAALAPNPCP